VTLQITFAVCEPGDPPSDRHYHYLCRNSRTGETGLVLGIKADSPQFPLPNGCDMWQQIDRFRNVPCWASNGDYEMYWIEEGRFSGTYRRRYAGDDLLSVWSSNAVCWD
jgi:hypothetical protein